MNKVLIAGLLSLSTVFPVLAQFNDSTILRPAPSFRTLPNSPTSPAISQRINLPAGQRLNTRLPNKETLYVSGGETVRAELVVTQPLIGDNGITLIPVGTIVRGEFVPAAGGSRFIARELSTRGVSVSLGAESELINDVKDPRETNAGSIIGDAAIGAAAAAILAGITGDRALATEEILAGAAAATIIGNTTAPQVVVIQPDSNINLTTTRGLTFGTR